MAIKCSVSLVSLLACAALVGCAGTDDNYMYDTPTVDYVERLNVNDAPHKDSFLNQLAMNYRSYAIYNARTSGYPDIGELFAQKAVSAFSGEAPFPESLENWDVESDAERFEIFTAYNNLMNELQVDAVESQPQLAAEAQAKFDCWLSAAASGQNATAQECRGRFLASLQALIDCQDGRVAQATRVTSQNLAPAPVVEKYYPETRRLSAMAGSTRTRDGIVIVNNVNIPENLIQPVSVPQQPMVFHQHIYGGEESMTSGDETFNGDSFVGDTVTKTKTKTNSENVTKTNSENITETETNTTNNTSTSTETNTTNNTSTETNTATETNTTNNTSTETNTTNNNSTETNITKELEKIQGDYVSRDEFINVMLALRSELAEINRRFDAKGAKPAPSSEKTVIKVQQIPLEPKQHVMEEIFEVRFDFDKATIKPEYEDLIRKLAATTQANKNVKVSVVGHTDTAGSSAYNYALGGRRADAVQKMLIEYGIPSSQIIAVSAGEEDLKVKTPNNTPNADNRRVRVVKEVHYTEPQKPAPIVVEEYKETADCADCDER